MLPPKTNGKTKFPKSINEVAIGGLIDEDSVLTVFVIAAVEARSSGCIIAFTYDCLVGTSICDIDCLRNRNIAAYSKLGANGTRIKKMLEGI